jgi:hypothetical protein
VVTVSLEARQSSRTKKRLSDLRVAIREVKQFRPESAGASGFPTLILAENKVAVKEKLVGKLPVKK